MHTLHSLETLADGDAQVPRASPWVCQCLPGVFYVLPSPLPHCNNIDYNLFMGWSLLHPLKQRSLNSWKALCLCIVTSSRHIQVFFKFNTRTYMFMQIYASSCSLMLAYCSSIPCPECSSSLLKFFCFSSFSWSRVLVQGVLLSRCFGLVQAFVLRWHLLAK